MERELTEHLIKLIESDDSRFTFECGSTDEMYLYDKKTKTSFVLYINKIKESD